MKAVFTLEGLHGNESLKIEHTGRIDEVRLNIDGRNTDVRTSEVYAALNALHALPTEKLGVNLGVGLSPVYGQTEAAEDSRAKKLADLEAKLHEHASTVQAATVERWRQYDKGLVDWAKKETERG